ncbi:hypothetical protein NST08_24620 [Paenibacillus sp. FSL K6-1566]|uniref:hypothetical protein n=1 Tax=Paenibacillus sp. FSL K6-1566 TaxID=2954515 RepID=UPI0031016CEC
MSFIEAIKRYQESGDTDAIKMIREAMNYDYLHSPTGLTFDKPEMYVAFRCLRLLRGRLATIKYTLSEHGLHSRRDSPEYIFGEFAAAIKGWTGIELTVENFQEHEKYLASYLPTFVDLRHAYERIIGARPTIWHMLTNEIIEENWPELEAALKYALERVDANRSEREIVRYINRATRTAYLRTQFEGMRRVRRDGQSRYVEPKYYGPIYAIFGSASIDIGRLSGRQRQLIHRISEIIKKDYEEGRIEAYAVDIKGGYRIINRHIAEKLGMHEASLSRAIGRISVKL